MPASYVHQSVAAHAADALSLFTSDAERSALLAGAEGPDPMFFCFRPGKPFAPVVASLLHTQKTDDFLLALCDACAGDALLRAYCCGFFTHYATDTTFHPFVYAHSLTAAGKYSGNAHCTLEHQLETLHYRREGHATGLPVQMGGFAALDAAQRKKIAAARACFRIPSSRPPGWKNAFRTRSACAASSAPRTAGATARWAACSPPSSWMKRSTRT